MSQENATAKLILRPQWVWVGGRFVAGQEVVIEQGLIRTVGPISDRADSSIVVDLDRQALAPGFVNAHSHAFQRGLRGRGERFPAGSGSFWTWRQAMYELVGSLNPESLYQLTRQAYSEMLRAGITAVGEFHYLHHQGNDQDYHFDEVVLRAARDTGIRLVLLSTYYRTGSIGKPLEPAQRRFGSGDLTLFLAQVDKLRQELEPETQTIGLVAHSIRAVPLEEIVLLHGEACKRRLPFHMHVEEQRQELEQSLRSYGATPMRLLLDRLEIGPEFTAVHCTHSKPVEMELFLRAGGNVCLCPLTEANLGDGIPVLPSDGQAVRHLCAGTDSNSRLSFTEELRWLEYVQRLRLERRGVLIDMEGSVASRLLTIGTRGGARALGLATGEIAPGKLADLVSLDLDDAALAGCGPEELIDGWIFGTGNGSIRHLWVGGRRLF